MKRIFNNVSRATGSAKQSRLSLSCAAGVLPAGGRRILLIVLLTLLSIPLHAHDMYIRPRFHQNNQVSLAMFVEKEEVVWFDSMTAGLRMDGPSGEATLSVPDRGDPVVAFDHEGTYTIGWESEPLFIQVEPEIFRKYIAVEGYRDASDLIKKTKQEDKPGREIYTRFIKSFVQIGAKPTPDFNRPFGYKLEIVPLQNPCALKPDSDLDVQVYYNGHPLPNHRIMATYDSYSTLPEDYAQVTHTDANGIARFRVTHAGLWLVRTNQMLPLENNAEADWQSFWANFTFEVK